MLIVLLILMVCGWINSNAQLTEYKTQMNKFDSKEQKYLETINEEGKRIVEQEQIILSQKDAITNNLLEIEKLKKLKARVVVNTITKIDSVFIPFVSDTTTFDTLVIDNYIIVPKRFSLQQEWYSMDGSILKDGLLMDNLSFNNELKITLGSKSEGIFKSPKPVVLVEYSNPYVSTTGMQNVVIKNDLKFYDRKTFWLGVGFVSGIGTSILINK